jgi:hypothetical protein
VMNGLTKFCVVLGLCTYFLTTGAVVQAYIIGDSDIVPTTGNEVASGNGLLDLKLFADSSASASNEYNGFDGDNANTDIASGGVTTMAEAYVTSIGELRDYYRLCFPDGNGGSIMNTMSLFIDLNQTPQNDIILTGLNVVVDYDPSFGDSRGDPWNNDVTTALQNSTTDGWSWEIGGPSPVGGTILSTIDSPKLLPLNSQGAEWADYAIRLNVDPFDSAFSDETRVLVYWASTVHDDLGETIFLSGQYIIPEPAMLLLFGLGAALLRRKA